MVNMQTRTSIETKLSNPYPARRVVWIFAMFAVVALWLTSAVIVRADAPAQQTDRNANCLMCHSDHDFKGSFQNGDLVSLYVDRGEYGQSVHSAAGLECLACHTDISQYPHHETEQITCTTCHPQQDGAINVAEATNTTLRVNLVYQDRRDMVLTLSDACRSCHESEFEAATGSAHQRMLEGGNRDAPVCVDCHGSHNVTKAGESRSDISHMCGDCHRAVYSTYRTSVHGEALDEESNPDVPTCTDCHGVHSVRGPRDAAFRNDSITICGHCHADEELMGQYNISTDVFDTYLDDFHGRTVDIFRRKEIGNPSNKAVCYDCHGIHNIRRPDDPLSTIYPDNLQHTCQQCHAEATIRFPEAWVSHYIPTWENTPALFGVNAAYKFVLIPGVLGGFIIYIGIDAQRRWSDRRRQLRQVVEQAKEGLNDDYDFTE